jgi:hypothetical protein
MSSCTTTVPNSVRNSDPVGHTSRQAAWVQCLHTLDIISQRKSVRGASMVRPGRSDIGIPRNCGPAAEGPVSAGPASAGPASVGAVVIVAAAASASKAGGTPGAVPVSCPVPAATTADSALADGPVGSPANAPGVSVPPPRPATGCSMNAT